MHLHLDPVGGVAGDMFVAALLDLAPHLAPDAIAAARAAGLDASVAVEHAHVDDGVLSGSRFVVTLPAGAEDDTHLAAPPHDHAHQHDDHHGRHAHHHHHEARESAAHAATHRHAHLHWRDLRARLQAMPLAAAVRGRAVQIFALLAEAEARVHGKPVESVAFHEVGALDSVADIVAAAWLIDALDIRSCSVGPLPLGSGRVRTAHGLLPVPAPATALLLEGLPCFDDGRAGERITPTGAAILRHLAPSAGLGMTPRVLKGSGHGFGSRRFEGLPNVLRALAFADVAAADDIGIDQVTTLCFEVDDQTPEDLAVGLERLRAERGVIDVVQGTVTGKHGRQAAAIRVLATPAASEAVAAACFRETTTLGVRVERAERRVLAREAHTSADGTRVKWARRGGVATVKVEMADLAQAGDHAAREAQRRSVEGSLDQPAWSREEHTP